MCVKALSVLLGGVAEVPSVLDMAVHGLTADSRQVRPGDAFVALKGSRGDASLYVDEAVSRGAVAVLLETDDQTGCAELGGALVIKVPKLSGSQGLLADRFFDSPSQALHVIGVTGTNGKSSVTRFLGDLLNTAGLRTATLGTLGYGFPGELLEASHTTPDVITVQRLLYQFRKNGAHAVVMEVSSHALEQGRVERVHFEGAVFTNLSRDHLDYHGTMEKYAAAKALLFTEASPRFMIINVDDEFGRQLVERVPASCQVWRYGIDKSDVEVRVRDLVMDETGFHAEMDTPLGKVTVSSVLMGRFNVSNLAAAVGAAAALNIDTRVLSSASTHLQAPPGRLQQIASASGLRVVVDYAHTPDALETALTAINAHTHEKTWCVFGCGGNRDPGKRPLMGAIAERLADHVVLTDDNPRDESPAAIVAAIRSGMKRPRNAVIEHDRSKAIAWALSHAGPNDLVLVAGKGHENYQERNGKRSTFSDADTVTRLLESAAGPGARQ